EIQQLLQQLPTESYVEIPFEADLANLYQLFDIFLHTPINATLEAFGQTYVEALAAGIPSIFTLSGVAPEFIVHEQNALVVEYQSSQAIYEAIEKLLQNELLRKKIVKQGQKDVQNLFPLHTMIQKLEKLYCQ
ncbi:MAG: glycosyltransferase family 4 protein, partial [Microscillaceae bacterium]|nr:glycosyltransferase family 4 protein [Microscillaceae bacterium]MDW8460830.1 glycosyltransferase family 4 protein [Cytophagales bacterium]